MSIRSQVERIKYLALGHAELERLCGAPGSNCSSAT
jgi:hypothetical protein